MDEPSAEQDLERGLTALAPRLASGATAITGLRRLTSGASQEIWRFDAVAGEAKTPLILRKAPAWISETALGPEAEAQLHDAAAAVGAPVPPVRYVLAPDDGIGRGFVMGFVEGETLGGRIVRSDAFADTRKILAHQCGEILARIHTIEPADFPNLRRLTPADLLDQYWTSYRASGWPRPVFELGFHWLHANCPPPPEHLKVVHGDFRNGNLMIGPEGVRAVLDWELTHVGDPMADLGWICTNPWRFGMVDLPVGGFGLREDLWAGYEAAGGAPVRRELAHWWEVFGSIRWGSMCAGMTASFRTADTSVERAVIARRTSENELDLLRLLAA